MERRTVELELRKRGEVINQHDEILPIKEFTNKKCQQNVAIKNRYQILSPTSNAQLCRSGGGCGDQGGV